MMNQKKENRWVQSFVTGLFIGYVPWAPGTFGTLLGIPIVYGLSYFDPLVYMGAILFFANIAIFLINKYSKDGEDDSQEIVIDEIIGFALTMTWLPTTWQTFLGGFLLFRFFDIVKPFPISWIDRNIKGGIGVMADDLLAGIFANILLQIVYRQTTWLGAQL